jgi:hypothetical protein
MGLIIYVYVQVYRVYSMYLDIQVRLNLYFVIEFGAISYLKSWQLHSWSWKFRPSKESKFNCRVYKRAPLNRVLSDMNPFNTRCCYSFKIKLTIKDEAQTALFKDPVRTTQ